MKLPVTNKPTSYLKNAFILSVILIIFFTIYFHYRDVRILIALLMIIIPLIIILLFSERKQNVQSLEFTQNILIVTYRKRKIEIPLSQVIEITSGLNLGFNLKFNIIKTYTILLNQNYIFGNKLMVDYKINKSAGVTIKEDPLPIIILKREIKREQKSNSI